MNKQYDSQNEKGERQTNRYENWKSSDIDSFKIPMNQSEDRKSKTDKWYYGYKK